MIKVLYLPLNFGDVVQTGVYDAFREAGVQLEVFDFFHIYQSNRKRKNLVRDMLLKKALGFKPDLIHMQIQHTSIIDANTIRNIKKRLPNTIITNWTGEVRIYVPKSYRDVAKYCDYNLISSTGQVDMFQKALGKPVKYWQIGYNPKLYFPARKPSNNFVWDACFVANYNAKESYPGKAARERVSMLLKSQFRDRFCLYGGSWPRKFHSKGSLDQKRLAQAYHKSVCAISVSHFNDLNHYFSDRLLMCMASGRPTVSLKFPKWESYFTDNCDLVMADSVDDIPKKVRWLKNNPDIASYIGKSGAEKVRAEHTYFSRVNELLDIVGLK